NVRAASEKIVDAVDSPQLVPNVGLVQLHRLQFKVTIYCQTMFAEDTQLTLFISHDHFHLVDPEATALPSYSAGPAESPVAPTATRANPIDPFDGISLEYLASRISVPALTTGPDGTIYKFGVYDDGQTALGRTVGSSRLWRL